MALRLRRAVTVAAAAVVFVILAGATYQGATTALERRQFPHPGRLVDVGGHQLHIDCRGSGTPTVVLEAPAVGMSAAWGWIQPAVAATTRVCSYDRAGLGWSEAGDEPFTPGSVARELRILLERTGEAAPYVIVGHGLGAAFAVLDAAQLGSAASGLLLVDAPAADGSGSLDAPEMRLVRASPWLARAGILRATGLIAGSADGLPDQAAGALRAFLNRPDHLTRAARELRSWDDTLRLAAGTALPHNPSIVHLEVESGDRMAFLTAQDDAERVARAVIALVAELREAGQGH